MAEKQKSRRQTQEQQRAAAAWKNIEVIDKSDDGVKKKYGTFARKLPSMIQINGFGSAMAFLQAKGKRKRDDGHTLLYEHIGKWVTAYMTGQSGDIMDYVRACETDDYRRATAEAVAYAIWLKRYVEAQDWGSATGDDDG